MKISEEDGFSLSCEMFKLCAPSFTLLGIIIIPKDVAGALKLSGGINFYACPEEEITQKLLEEIAQQKKKTGTLELSNEFGGSVVIHGDLAMLEKVPGFGFIPGAGYLKSLFKEEA